MKVIVLYTMEGCPFCGMIKEILDNENYSYLERDIHEHSEEYDEFSKTTENDFIPAFMLLTLDEKDNAHNVKLCAPDRDFEDVFQGVDIIRNYFLD